MPIHFFQEDIDFIPENAESLQHWIIQITTDHHYSIKNLNYIFCSDQHLLNINKKYLNHEHFTDIITFDNSTENKVIESDIFISIDRVKDNSNVFKTTFEEELYRVMIHGLLHLIGYDDGNHLDKKRMKKKEDVCLSLLSIQGST
ncbi:MAG: rRNA maturation RNase YbeY [Bacteroidota bacterium]